MADPTAESPPSPSTSSALSASPSTPQDALRKKFKPLVMPSRESQEQEDVMNNCFVKTVMAGAMGGLFGVAFGLFTASMDNAGGGFEAVPVETTKSTRVVLKEMLVNMKTKSLSYAKGFALVGSVYSFSECIIEKHRGRHDKWNPMLAGCATGGTLAMSGGPKAACIGCASFAAFSVAIEYFLDTH